MANWSSQLKPLTILPEPRTSKMATSWVKTITSPFRKACTFLNQQNQDKKPKESGFEKKTMDLQGEVMACAYEDVRVMWSMLDKSNDPTPSS